MARLMGQFSFGPPGDGEVPPRIQGAAGASARRVYERRRANRERSTLERHPRLGPVLLTLRKKPAHELSWATGAEGERRVADTLANRCGQDVLLCHDRRMPGSTANIDHLAITPSGVWVIDTKRYKGPVKVERSLLREGRLRINGRDQTKLADGLDRQIEAVRDVLSNVAGDVEVNGALCFVDSELALFRKLSFRGHSLLTPRQLSKRLNAKGSLARERIELLAQQLGAAFPAA